jgi:hypothetical protein
MYNNGEEMNTCGIVVEKPQENRPLGKPRSRWVDKNK